MASNYVLSAGWPALILICFPLILLSSDSYGQDWPIHQLPAEDVVPQYQPPVPPATDYNQLDPQPLNSISHTSPAPDTATAATLQPKTSQPSNSAASLPPTQTQQLAPIHPRGCTCGCRSGQQRNDQSLYWPRPFSARLENRFPNHTSRNPTVCDQPKRIDRFGSMANFKLIPYKRSDNGYCGRDADPYGCLGESQYRSRVVGVQNRNAGTPAAIPASLSKRQKNMPTPVTRHR